jgi:Fe-S-cluster containining protein
MEEISKLAEKTLGDLSGFCIGECHAFCCRKGYLILNEEELNLIVDDKKEILFEKKDLKELLNGKFSLNLNNFSGSCPKLKDFKCEIHNNAKRPNTCKNFPIFIVGKEIKISCQCPAKAENKFFAFVYNVEKMGYKIVENFFDN